MDVLPDDLRHRLDFRVISETVAGGNLVQETLLEAKDFSDTLVGIPVGFLNIERDGLKALGANIASALSGATTYLPCLLLGESAIVGPGALRFGGSRGATDDVFGAPLATPRTTSKGSPPRSGWRSTITSPGAEPVTVRRGLRPHRAGISV